MNLKRSIRLRLNAWRARLERWREWYWRATCPHSWRPARIGDRPGRSCRMCDLAEVMREADFFAQFGEVNWRKW